MMWRLGKRLDELLILRPDPPNTATGQVFRPTRQSFLYELIGWAIGQIFTLFFLILFLFGAPIVAAFAWTGWSWILEFALQWATWLDRLLLTFVPDAFHVLIPVLGVLAFVTQMLLTLIGVWAKQRYTWLVAGDEGLRLHRGWFRTHDVTMRYAVVQQVHLRQGPLQRLFGIGDVEIGSASNSHDDEDEGKRKTRIQNITHPSDLRDLVRSRAEATHRGSAPPTTAPTSAAAVELLQAARELRLVLAQPDAAEHDPAVEFNVAPVAQDR